MRIRAREREREMERELLKKSDCFSQVRVDIGSCKGLYRAPRKGLCAVVSNFCLARALIAKHAYLFRGLNVKF